MKFTKYEELLIIQASGDYWFIDAFSGKLYKAIIQLQQINNKNIEDVNFWVVTN